MKISKSFTIYSLVFLFGFLFLKNLLPDLVDHSLDNCDEVGHVHYYSIEKKGFEHHKADESCHSAQSLFAVALFPTKLFPIFYPRWIPTFSLILNLQNNFKAPYLEPRKKPPRFS